MIGPEYWQALRHSDYWFSYGDSPDDAYQQLLASDEEIPVNTHARGFILIDDTPQVIAERLRQMAEWDQERLWLRQYATAIVDDPGNAEMIARALINLPDGRILDPDGPLGCRQSSATTWVFFGFVPIDECEETSVDTASVEVEPMKVGESCEDEDAEVIAARIQAANVLNTGTCAACGRGSFCDYCFTCEVAFLNCYGGVRCSRPQPHVAESHETLLEPFWFKFCEKCYKAFEGEDDDEHRCPRCRRI
jgi:hypothetical protein